MKKYLLGFIFALASAIIGMLPLDVTTSALGYPLNPLWGSVYGFGWYVVLLAGGGRCSREAFFGSVVWPIFMMIVVTIVAGRVFSASNKRRTLTVGIALLSLCAFVPTTITPTAVLRWLPIYSEIMSVCY